MTATPSPPPDGLLEELLGDFIDESGQLLDRLNENLLVLDEWVRSLDEPELTRCDEGLLNEMFRAAHSLKGLSAMLGLKEINNLTHRMENVFDAARKNQVQFTGDLVELMFQGVDRLAAMVEALRDPSAGPVDYQPVLEGIQRALSESEKPGARWGWPAVGEAAVCPSQTAEVRDNPPRTDTTDGAYSAPPTPTAVHAAPAASTPATSSASSASPSGTAPVAFAGCPTGSEASGTGTGGRAASPIPAAAQPVGSQATQVPDPFADLRDETEIPGKYLAIFIDEAEVSLDELTETLLAGEEAGSRDALEKLLVTAHRIKGSAASVGLHRAAKLAHLMEDLLQNLILRNGTLSARLTDALLRCTDGLREYIGGLRNGTACSEHFGALAIELMAADESRVPSAGSLPAGPSGAGSKPSSSEPTRQASGSAPPARSIPEALRQEVSAVAPDEGTTLVGQVIFRPNLPLVTLKAQLIYEKLLHLGQLCYFDPPAEQLEQLEELERVAFGLTTDTAAEAVARQLYVGGVEHVAVEPLGVAVGASTGAQHETKRSPAKAPAGEAPQTQRGSEAPGPSLGKADWSVLGRGGQTEGKPAGGAASTRQSSPMAPGPIPRFSGPSQPSAADAKTPASQASVPPNLAKPNETLRVDIERLDQLMNLAGQLVINKARFARISDRLKNSLAFRDTDRRLDHILAGLEEMAAGSAGTGRTDSLPGELERLGSLARQLHRELDSVRREVAALATVRGALNELGEAIHQLDRVSDGIQRSVMDTRMVPIGPLFHRFKRVVRDITRASGKSVRLVIKGEKTDLDKRMIDELGDPLIHMVRNSADHGIELPEERLRAGKPREGTITLNAFHRGNSIVIQVSDDGRGLDAERILQKAIAKGLVSPADAERLTRQQIYNLIWEPGLTTAEKVTEVSGRGMGMDIVRSKIEELSGTVELDSTPGQGTTITIRLPLTLAILPSLLVQIGSEIFAVPIESVAEIVRVGRDELATVHGVWTARVRGRILSVAKLDDVFTWNQRHAPSVTLQTEETTLVIVGDRGREIALAVTDVLGEEDIVIKSMAENYRNVAGIAGASILGDGRVSLILDTPALIDMATRRVAAGSLP